MSWRMRNIGRADTVRFYQLVSLPIIIKFGKIVKTAIQSCDINAHGDFLNRFAYTKH